MKKVTLGLLVLFALGLLGVVGCGGGGGGGTTGSVAGTVFAPDGATPIADAYVYVPEGGVRVGEPITYAYSEADGDFVLDNVPEGTVTINIDKGSWHKVFEAVVHGGQTTDAPASDTTLPDQGTGVPKIAVVTGDWDHMEDVLAKLGLGQVDGSGTLIPGTEKFTLIDGNGTLDPPYEDFDAILTDPTKLQSYDIIFINCGNNYENLLFDAPGATQIKSNLQDYVSGGGSLYVTDWSYDFVEQSFPEFIDFYGSDEIAPSDPENWDEAAVGTDGVTNDATVVDPTLKSWLQNLPGGSVLNPDDDTVPIAGFLGGWVVMNSANTAAGTKVWIQANDFVYPSVPASARASRHGRVLAGSRGEAAGDPLTVTFSHGQGKVLYSSYHTEETPSPDLRPQERVLAYLVFEVS